MEMGVIGLSLVLVVVYLLLKQPTRKESWWLGCYGAVVAGCLVQFGESSILGIDSMFSPMFWILALASVSVFPPNPGTDSQGRKADAAAPVRLSRGHPGLAAPGRPTGSIRSSPRPHRRRIVVEAGVLRRPETPLSDTAALWGVSDVSTSSAAMLGGAATRAMAFVIDEGLSSLQNFAIMFAALRYLSISTLGFFTLAYNAGLLTETLLRSLLLAPLTIRYSHVSSSDQRRAGSRAAGASIEAGLLCAAIAVVVSWALRGDYREMLLALGFATLMLIVQEAWRVYFFTQRRPWLAVLNDGFCLLSTLALLVLVVAERGHPSAATLLVIWGAGTGCGAILGMGQAHLLPAVSQSWSWLREHWSLGSRLAGAQSAERLASQIAFILTAAIAGGVALGQISASRTLISPFTTLVVAVGTFAAPEAARLYHRRSGAFRLFTLAISVALTGAVAVFGVAIYALPDSIGRHMAGANWLSAKALLLPILVWTGSNAFRSGALTGLQVMERARQVLRFSLLTGLATLVAVPIGVTLSGAGGAAWAFATVSAITALCYWVVFARVSRDIRPDSDIHTSAVDQSASSVR
jgi:O-antigen/teichoic acid export membrane protein